MEETAGGGRVRYAASAHFLEEQRPSPAHRGKGGKERNGEGSVAKTKNSFFLFKVLKKKMFFFRKKKLLRFFFK